MRNVNGGGVQLSVFRAGVVVLMALACHAPARGAEREALADGAWARVAAHLAPERAEDDRPWVRPSAGAALELDRGALAATLEQAPPEPGPGAEQAPLVISLPDPTGVLQQFAVFATVVMERGLAAEFPEIRTYAGYGLDDRSASVRLTMTPAGFDAQVLSAHGNWYIDRYSAGDADRYTSYYKRDLVNPYRWACFTSAEATPVKGGGEAQQIFLPENIGTNLRTFRLACAATGEYTAYHGGTVALGQAAIVTAINRVTGVYERELGIRLVLVSNNSSVVYTNATTDPYTNSSGSTMLSENQTNLNAVIQTANYDIGHVFSTGGGGIASLGSVCNATRKAQGVTGSPAPIGDPFTIDYVAHEMGHQFGAAHTFNSSTGNCGGGNRTATAAFEPGSGSTIMAYAGICGTDDLQPNSDAYFHSYSFEQIQAYLATVSCGTNAATGNGLLTFTSVQATTSIPARTPFTVTAAATDPNGDALTYCWEERDLGATLTLTASDNGTSPLFRSYSPVSSGSRTFPRWSVILNNANVDSTNHEKLPTASRTLNLRVTARDNRAGGGAVRSAAATLNVVGTAGPFAVTSPNTGVSWSGARTVTWSVANTNISPINCATVDVLLSTDNGATFPTVLAAGVPNTGAAAVTLPGVSSNSARIMVRAVGNVFFDVSDVPFSITAPLPGVALSGAGTNTAADTGGNGNANGIIEPGESAVAVNVAVSNGGGTNATGVTGVLTSNTPTVSVVTGSASYGSVNSLATGTNLTPYVISVSPGHVCGTPISLSVAFNSAQGGGSAYTFTLPTGTAGGATPLQEFRWTGVQAIPDNSTTGTTVNVPVSGLSGTIAGVQFRFNGSSCSTTATSTTVGLNHSFVGDLVVTLIAPDGTSVILANQPGGSSGNNFCQTLFRDDASASIQTISSAGTGAPYAGGWVPAQPLSGLIGRSPNGTWQLKVQDLDAVDTGSVRDFSILISTTLPPSCQPANPVSTCPVDYNADQFVNLDDLGDFITDFYTTPTIPGGVQALAPTFPGVAVGYGVPCPAAFDAPPPYTVDAYRVSGFRVGYSADGSNACPLDALTPFPNLDNLNDFLTYYYSEPACP